MTGLRQLADELLDNNERFQQFVMISFDDEADANQQLPRERCLKALVAVYELIAAVLPPAGRRLITRPPEAADVDAELHGGRSGPLDFDAYDELARAVFRRIAVDRVGRLVNGMLIGTLCVAALKATVRRTPLIGALAHALLVPLLPTTLVSGPALGIAACAYLPAEAFTPRWNNKGRPPLTKGPRPARTHSTGSVRSSGD